MSGKAMLTHQDCVEWLTAEAYILGELSDAEGADFEEHYFMCRDCAEAVRCLMQLREAARESHREAEASEFRESFSLRLPSWVSWWLRPQTAAACALALGAFVVMARYQRFQLQDELRPQSVGSILLRPETRGEISKLRLQAAGRFALLEADLPGASGMMSWSIRTPDGRVRMDGVGSAPDPGLSFKLLVPVVHLESGEYTLLIRSDARREWTFRFKTDTH
jgi:hypothetical protein